MNENAPFEFRFHSEISNTHTSKHRPSNIKLSPNTQTNTSITVTKNFLRKTQQQQIMGHKCISRSFLAFMFAFLIIFMHNDDKITISTVAAFSSNKIIRKLASRTVSDLPRSSACKSNDNGNVGRLGPLSGRRRPGGQEEGKNPNWLERSIPIDDSSAEGEKPFFDDDDDDADEVNLEKIEDYNLGICGADFQVGTLSKRTWETIVQSKSGSNLNIDQNPEIKRSFLLYVMNFAAKVAAKAALKQNGLELALPDNDHSEQGQEENMSWGDVGSIQLIDRDTDIAVGPLYDSLEGAVQDWAPGQDFNFCIRQVPARQRELSLTELLNSLDPTGSFRDSAKEANITMRDEIEVDEVRSLTDLANRNIQRAQMVPLEPSLSEEKAYPGDGGKSRGYRVISANALKKSSRNEDGTETRSTLMHVMDALVSHGCLVVKLIDASNGPDERKKVASVCKNVARIAVTACTVEAGGPEPAVASEMASLLADELLDEGNESVNASNEVDDASSLGLCRGFFTAMPVAAVSGLEVYDEAAEQWYRPELAARKDWFDSTGSIADKGKESAAASDIPWHANYVVIMPGELLQLATRDEIEASIYRFVGPNQPSRLAVPIFVRGRPNARLDVARYLDDAVSNPLTEECDGMTMKQVTDALQLTQPQ